MEISEIKEFGEKEINTRLDKPQPCVLYGLKTSHAHDGVACCDVCKGKYGKLLDNKIKEKLSK